MRATRETFLILLLFAGIARADTASDAAKKVAELMDDDADDHGAQIVATLQGESDLDRFNTLRILDRTDETTVRRVYDVLKDGDRATLLQLTQSAGAAGTAAGLQEVGTISDNDDTAFPTEYTPDGPIAYKGSADFYKLLVSGTDGKGDPGNLHYVSARIPALFVNSRERIRAAGLPMGTFDGDSNVERYLTGGLDGIQQSKIENIDLWLKLHPGQKFVFLGDSLQRDPEVYRWVLQNHPDQVELVMIHKAGGPVRAPADYKGEVFFDDYVQAKKIVTDLGIPQPGARLPAKTPDADGLPLPSTDVSSETNAEKKENIFTKIGDFFAENVGSIFHKHPKTTTAPAAAPSVTPPPAAQSTGLTNALDKAQSPPASKAP
jgi:hypothetical protein